MHACIRMAMEGQDQEPYRFRKHYSGPHAISYKTEQKSLVTISNTISQLNKTTQPSVKDHIKTVTLPRQCFSSLSEIEGEV